MTNIKTWLDTNYPENKRENLVELYLFGKDLEGELSIRDEDFPNLERIFYGEQVRIVHSFEINLASILGKPVPKGVRIFHNHRIELLKHTSLTEILETKYPKKERGGITNLDLTRQGLRGDLNLEDFTNLEELKIELDCSWYRRGSTSNYITNLDLSKNTKLKKITLTNNPAKLNLNIFENLTNLEELNIPGSDISWVGSAKSLKDLPIKNLNISNNSKITDWENLPITITKLKCKGTTLVEEIKPFAFDVKAWKLINYPDLITTDKEKLIKELNSKLEDSHLTIKSLNKRQLTDDDLVNQIEILETRNRELLK